MSIAAIVPWANPLSWLTKSLQCKGMVQEPKAVLCIPSGLQENQIVSLAPSASSLFQKMTSEDIGLAWKD